MAKVGIVMGSDSDLAVMSKAADVLEEFGIEYEMTIISAHREPDVFFEYARQRGKRLESDHRRRGNGCTSSGYVRGNLPYAGDRCTHAYHSLGGRDSLYSIVQMPCGIPVATVAINGGANAAFLRPRFCNFRWTLCWDG